MYENIGNPSQINFLIEDSLKIFSSLEMIPELLVTYYEILILRIRFTSNSHLMDCIFRLSIHLLKEFSYLPVQKRLFSVHTGRLLNLIHMKENPIILEQKLKKLRKISKQILPKAGSKSRFFVLFTLEIFTSFADINKSPPNLEKTELFFSNLTEKRRAKGEEAFQGFFCFFSFSELVHNLSLMLMEKRGANGRGPK